MSASSKPRAFRVSLREILLLFAAVAIGCAALKFANPWWLAAVAAATMLAFMAGAIVALVDRGRRQAFALGFVAIVGIYMLLVFAMREQAGDRASNPEFDPYEGALPTTHVLRPLFEAVSENWYIEKATGKRVRHAQLPDGGSFGFSMAGGMMNTTAQFARAGETPRREHFMPIGHCLWALLLGYAGGHFARFVYARRMGEEAMSQNR